ncbi:MAG TPA: hypothetical protein PKN24_11245 [bacterium]|nr:hypothetical protein [bacterium]
MRTWQLLFLLAAIGLAWGESSFHKLSGGLEQFSAPSGTGMRIVRLNDNPFDTAIRFRAAICSARLFELDIQTADGRSVDGLCADSLVVGAYEVEWTPHDLPSGVYYLHFRNGGEHQVEIVALLR